MRPVLESTAALRELIHRKRAHGQLTKALILARLAGQVAKLEGVGAVRDGISRVALERYVELMPEDGEAQQILLSLAPSVPVALPVALATPAISTSRLALNARHRLLWPVLLVGIVSPASIHWWEPLQSWWSPSPPKSSTVQIAFIAPMPVLSISAPKVVADSAPIVIRAVGDVVLGSDYPQNRLPTPSDKVRIATLHQVLRQADVVVGNLEGVLSDTGNSRKDVSKPGFFTFRMPESFATTLREMGFDVMSLANNHSMDFGEQGLQSTINALRANGIAPMGVSGAKVATITVRNTTVAFLNYSYLPAFTRMNDMQRVRTEIEYARTQASWVVVSFHGGKEGSEAVGIPQGDEYYLNEYRGDLVEFAHLAIDAGASAVFGHGPHVVRPYELYQGKPIFYSLGNFVGYRSLSTHGKLAHSIVAEVRFSPQGDFLGAGILPLKLDISGIPVVDYSTENLKNLSDLLLDQLDNRPVLGLRNQQGFGVENRR